MQIKHYVIPIKEQDSVWWNTHNIPKLREYLETKNPISFPDIRTTDACLKIPITFGRGNNIHLLVPNNLPYYGRVSENVMKHYLYKYNPDGGAWTDAGIISTDVLRNRDTDKYDCRGYTCHDNDEGSIHVYFPCAIGYEICSISVGIGIFMCAVMAYVVSRIVSSVLG